MSTQYRPHNVIREDLADGAMILRAAEPLGEVVERTTDWLDHWAEKTPDAVFLAERCGEGWREVSYAQSRDFARALAGGLLGLGLGPDAPVMIITGNSVSHGLLALAAQYIGAPVVPVAEQYALIPDARVQLDFVAGLTKPAAVFAEDGRALADVLQRDAFANIHRLFSTDTGKAIFKDGLTLDELAAKGGDITSAHAAVGPDTIAKYLMTSGSTSSPKGVLTTHRMLCTNQAQLAHTLPFLKDHTPRLVDWLPWNHTFGGSHNFNMMLANGGAIYIDSGKPAPGMVEKSIENLRLKTGTIAFNVPVGFARLCEVMTHDKTLRHDFFKELDMLFYAGASLPQDIWARLEEMAREVRGDMPLFTSSWGLTETAPAAALQHEPTDRSGVIGVPMPGVELKLIPDDDMRCEIRVRGPSVFTGYLNDPEKTAAAFDDEGFFRTGDAVKFVDPENVNLGLAFDGRLSEDFKLLTGTWVRAANLRLNVLVALGSLAIDVVITGADRDQIGLLIIPAASVRDADGLTDDNGALIVPQVMSQISDALKSEGSSSSTRIARAMILSEPPQIAEGEITAKGNINFNKLLKRRASLLERLYDKETSGDDPAIIHIT